MTSQITQPADHQRAEQVLLDGGVARTHRRALSELSALLRWLLQPPLLDLLFTQLVGRVGGKKQKKKQARIAVAEHSARASRSSEQPVHHQTLLWLPLQRHL